MPSPTREMLTSATGRALEAMAELAGTSVRMDFTHEVVKGPEGLADLAKNDHRIDIHLVGGTGRSIGLVVPRKFMIAIGAGIMMMPAPPEDMTEDVTLAFDEAINVGIGAWNRGLEATDWRLDNGVDARVLRPVAAVIDDVATTQVWHFDLFLGNTKYPIVLLGDGLLPVDAPVVAVAPVAASRPSPRPSASGTAKPDVGAKTLFATAASLEDEPLPRPSRPRPVERLEEEGDGARVEALIMLVDETGALRRWLAEQLRNPQFTFGREESASASNERTVVLVGEHGLDTVGVTARKKIVMRLA